MELSTYMLVVIIAALAAAAFLLARSINRERKKNEYLSELITASEIYTVTWTTDFSRVEVNKALSGFLKTIGMKPDEKFLKTLFLDDASLGTTGGVLLMGAMLKTGRKTVFTLPDGSKKHILWKSRIVGTGDSYSTVVSAGMDITENVQLNAQLSDIKHLHAAADEGLKVAAESADFGILTIKQSTHGFVLDITPKGLSMLGMKESSFAELTDKIAPADRERLSNTIYSLFRGEISTADLGLNVETGNGRFHRFVFRLKTAKNPDNDLHRITAAFIDTSEERKNVENIDPLTGLLTRRSFLTEGEDFLAECREEGLRAAVVSIKIDRFQKISTLFSHEIADRLLTVYAQGMAKCSTKPALFGKMSHDAFGAIISCQNREAAEKFVKNLSLYIENACNDKLLPSILMGQSRFTAGICLYNGEDGINEAFNKADLSLIADFSEDGGACRFFSNEIAMKIYSRDIIEQELRSALENGELELYYQPKTNFDGEIYGAEALMRWNHPQNGIMRPELFIPVAEECGLITRIDEWGLMEACRQAKEWQDKGCKKIRVSVNMSQLQLFKTDVVASIKKALTDTGLPPKNLEVELTETMAMQDIDRTVSILSEIRSLGVFVSMDDFGTGYSSLSALKILPVDILKIDRSLICDICFNSNSYNIVKAIVEMGNALKLEVLAEGIETEEQSELLRSLGCHIAQGYFYSKPLSASDMEKAIQ